MPERVLGDRDVEAPDGHAREQDQIGGVEPAHDATPLWPADRRNFASRQKPNRSLSALTLTSPMNSARSSPSTSGRARPARSI